MEKGKLKKEIKNHFHYRVWVYLVIALACWFGADLLYTMTEYRSPAERKVDFQLVQGGYADTEALSAAVADKALAAGQAYDETLEEVSFYAITYSGDGNEDVYGAQVFMVRVAAQEGDVWILPRVLFEQLYGQGALLALDEVVAEGLIDTAGLDLAGGTLPELSGETDEAGAPLILEGKTHLYGLRVDGLQGLRQVGYAQEDAYAVIMAYSKNPETSAVVLNAVMEQLRDGLPEEGEGA